MLSRRLPATVNGPLPRLKMLGDELRPNKSQVFGAVFNGAGHWAWKCEVDSPEFSDCSAQRRTNCPTAPIYAAPIVILNAEILLPDPRLCNCLTRLSWFSD